MFSLALPSIFPRPRRWMLVCLIGLLGPAGCSSLPTFVPDLARRPATPVQLEGARGPLSAAQSKAILDGLRSRGPDTDIFDRHLAIEEAIVGSPLTVGNRVQLLQDGPATYRAMLAAINAARDHINMETYILDDDDVGHQFAQTLIAKQRQGVQVNLIRDSVGTIGTPAAFFERLVVNGIRVLEFNPLNPLAVRKDWELNQRDHRKLLIVDGRIAFLGGINISSVYSGGSSKAVARTPTERTPVRTAGGAPDSGPEGRPEGALAWRDTDLQLQGPVVAELQKMFLATWAAQKGAPLAARNFFPRLDNVGRQVVRAIGQLARRALQPDLRHAAFGDCQRRDQRAHHERLFRPRPATARGARGGGRARRRREADPAEPDRFVARLSRRTRLLRPAAARRREDP